MKQSEFGTWVQDTCTSFFGRVIGYAEYQFDTPSILVQPDVTKDGQSVPAVWFSQARFVHKH